MPDMFQFANSLYVLKFCYQSFGTPLSGHALLNASQTTADDIIAK
jgi:hypothetical protein